MFEIQWHLPVLKLHQSFGKNITLPLVYVCICPTTLQAPVVSSISCAKPFTGKLKVRHQRCEVLLPDSRMKQSFPTICTNTWTFNSMCSVKQRCFVEFPSLSPNCTKPSVRSRRWVTNSPHEHFWQRHRSIGTFSEQYLPTAIWTSKRAERGYKISERGYKISHEVLPATHRYAGSTGWIGSTGKGATLEMSCPKGVFVTGVDDVLVLDDPLGSMEAAKSLRP